MTVENLSQHLSISLASIAYSDQTVRDATVEAVRGLPGVTDVQFNYNGIDGAGFQVRADGDVDIEQIACAIATLEGVEHVGVYNDADTNKNNYSYVVFERKGGEITREQRNFSSKPATQKRDPADDKKLSIRFNDYADKTFGERRAVSDQVRGMTEVESVYHERTNDGDICQVVVRNPADRDSVSKKIAVMPGVECTFNY